MEVGYMVDMTTESCIDNGCVLCKYSNMKSPCPAHFKLASMETLIARYIDEDSVSRKNAIKESLLKYYNYHIDSNDNKEEMKK